MVGINMEMPSSCYDCPFVKNERTNDYGSFCECGLLEDYVTINLLEHDKHPNCPLVEIGTCKDCRHIGAIYADGDCFCNKDELLREGTFHCSNFEKRGR